MPDGGKVFGLFCALVVLTCSVPLIFLLIRWWRRNKMDQNTIFEQQLSRGVKEAMRNRRVFAFEEMKKNRSTVNVMLQKASSVSRDIISSVDLKLSNSNDDEENGLIDDNIALTKSLQTAFNDQHAYFGIRDVLFPDGILKMGCMSLHLPPGLLEDLLLYICNNTNPLPFLFGDSDNPISMMSRFVVYANSQVFALSFYLLITDYRWMIKILFSPVIIFFEFWLTRLIACPCLPRDSSQDDKKTWEVWGKRTLRVIGGVMALPLLVVLIFLLIVLAFGLENGSINKPLLGRFVYDGIVVPFLIKMCFVFISFGYKLHPHHVNVCGVNVLKVNNWMELQYIEEDIARSEHLSTEDFKAKNAANWKKSFGEASIFHMNCYILRYIGLSADPNYRIDVCHPSCYCGRCCNAISELYWEVPEHETMHPRRSLATTHPYCPPADQDPIDVREVTSNENVSNML